MMSWPSTVTVPALGVTMPQTMLMSVVLPAPFGPSSAKRRPARAFERGQLDAEIAQHRVAGSQKVFGERHTEASGEMVVAAAREAQLARCRGQRALNVDDGQRFDRLGDVGAGQAEVLRATL